MLAFPDKLIHCLFHRCKCRLIEVNIVINRDKHFLDRTLRERIKVGCREEVDALAAVDCVCELVVAGLPVNIVEFHLAAVVGLEGFELDRCFLSCAVRVDIPVCHPLDGFVFQCAGQQFALVSQGAEFFLIGGIQRFVVAGLVILFAAARQNAERGCRQHHCCDCGS